jgi:hypothetical protein
MADKTVIFNGGNAGLGCQGAKNVALSDPSYYVVVTCRAWRGPRSAGAVIASLQQPRPTNR